MARSILFVHAHPDDESIGTGATMAQYAAEGTHVTLVTCTLGEEGEIHLPELAQLEAAQADQLGGYRLTELSKACAALGVVDHRMLGGTGRYRDSGMMGTPANEHPRCFWRADLDEAAEYLVQIIDEVRPQVVVTYDDNGFYGHPDHIQSHRVAVRASNIATERGFGPSKVYWTAMPLSVLKAGVEALAGSTDNPFAAITDVSEFPFGTPDDQVTACIDASDHHDAKIAALRAHASQIPETSWLYSIAGNFGQEFMGVEHFSIGIGKRGPGGGPNGWETDLFSGLPEKQEPGSGLPEKQEPGSGLPEKQEPGSGLGVPDESGK